NDGFEKVEIHHVTACVFAEPRRIRQPPARRLGDQRVECRSSDSEPQGSTAWTIRAAIELRFPNKSLIHEMPPRGADHRVGASAEHREVRASRSAFARLAS